MIPVRSAWLIVANFSKNPDILKLYNHCGILKQSPKPIRTRCEPAAINLLLNSNALPVSRHRHFARLASFLGENLLAMIEQAIANMGHSLALRIYFGYFEKQQCYLI